MASILVKKKKFMLNVLVPFDNLIWLSLKEKDYQDLN
jgi:hypothetical protein